MTNATVTTISTNGKYYQCVEKTTSRVSVKWKVFHVAIFIALALDAFITAWSVGHIQSTFNYNCILYSTISFNNKSSSRPLRNATDEPPTSTPTIDDESTTVFATELPRNSTRSGTDTNDDEPDEHVFANETFVKFENETHYVDSKIDKRTTRFSGSSTCDFVLFTPLISMIVAAVLGVVLAMCSRGGAGYPNDTMTGSQHLVYPMIIVSGIFIIINAVASGTFVNGFNAFCEHFEVFSGSKKCNSLIDITTLEFQETKVPLFQYYLTAKYTLYIGISLWCLQVAVTLLRIFCFVDYDLYNLEINKENDETEDVTTIMEDISLDTEMTSKV